MSDAQEATAAAIGGVVAPTSLENALSASIAKHDHATRGPVPSVPDADGKAIVVGQLVEHYARPHLGWCIEIMDDGRIKVGTEHDAGENWCSRAHQWRIVNETVRPPEPATRDVELRVRLEVGRDVADADLAADVREALYQRGDVEADWSCASVEVVE